MLRIYRVLKLGNLFTKNIFQTSNYSFLKKTVSNFDENKLCLVDQFNQYKYDDILSLSKRLSINLLNSLKISNEKGLNSQKIGIYCSNDYSYLVSILAVWMANGVPFCLNKNFPPKFIEYYLNDSDCKLVINSTVDRENPQTAEFEKMLCSKNIFNLKIGSNFHLDSFKDHSIDFRQFISELNQNTTKREALLLYTSGTSGPAKG